MVVVAVVAVGEFLERFCEWEAAAEGGKKMSAVEGETYHSAKT